MVNAVMLSSGCGEGGRRMLLRRQAGLSMIEVVVVIGVIAVLSAIAATTITFQLPSMRLSAAARRVMTDLMLARMEAVKKNADVNVAFSSSGYTISGKAAANIPSEYKGITIAGTNAPSVTFRSTGTASTALQVTVAGAAGSRQVEVSSAGRVRIR